MYYFLSVKVYRVQLPEKNAFYEVSDPEEQATLQRFRDKQCGSALSYDSINALCSH